MKDFARQVRLVLVGMATVLCAWATHAKSPESDLDVLHWWTSNSERWAANTLAMHFAYSDVHWMDAAIPGGGGMAAVKVLKSRVLMGDPPDVAQLIGATLTDWADVHLVLPLNTVAQREHWNQRLFPTVMQLITYKGNVIAAPLGIHRINTLLYNRHLFQRIGMEPPKTWAQFEIVSKKFKDLGVRPLAWSDEPWQIATVFESVLLGEVGPEMYNDLIVRRQAESWTDQRVTRALLRLRWLRQIASDTPKERAWSKSAFDVLQGDAAMLIMGDWAKGELMAWGANSEQDFGCAAVPGTQRMHLYSIDTLAMLMSKRHRQKAQETVAQIIVNTDVQLDYNRVKGSVPVLNDIDAAKLDQCASDSWTTFANPRNARVPSLAHRMAADENIKDAVAQALWRYLVNPQGDTADLQRRLASIMRTPLLLR